MSKALQKLKGLFSATDLTKGSISKTLIRFCVPVFISYLLQNFYNVADAAICGHTLSASEVAGVNDTSSITFIFLQFSFGCTAGMSVIISNCIGNADKESARRSFATIIVLSLIIVAVISVAGVLCADPLLRLLGITPSGNAVNNEVYKAAYIYIAVVCGGIAGLFFYNVICCVLRSVGDSFTPLVFLGVSSVLNIALDLLFIMAFGWGVAGAAAATVTAQIVSATACFIFTFVKYKDLRLRLSDFKNITLRDCGKILWQGIPLGLQFSVLAFGIITMSNVVISFDKTAQGIMIAGTPAQIGYTTACKLDNIFMTPLNAIGTAMISFCGQNYGAGKYDRIKKGTTRALLIMFIISLAELIAGLLLTIGGTYQHLFLANDKITADSIRFGNIYLYAALPAFWLLGALFILRNSVQGLGKPVYPFLAGIAELAARIAMCLTLPRIVNGGPINCNASNLSFFCLSLADTVAWLAADIFLVIAAVKYIYKLKPIPAPIQPQPVENECNALAATFADPTYDSTDAPNQKNQKN